MIHRVTSSTSVSIVVTAAFVLACSPGSPVEPLAAPPGEPDPTVNHDLTAGEPLSPGDRIDLGQADLTLGAASAEVLGSAIAFPGDLDGDGYGDAVIGSTTFEGDLGRSIVRVLWGGPRMAEPPLSSATLEGWFGAAVGIALAPAGDVDGDGRADLLVGVVSGGPNTVVVVYGGERWTGAKDLRTAGPVLRDDEHESAFGVELGGVGDIDGDGFADFAIGAPSAVEAGALYVFSGRGERLAGRLSAQTEATFLLRTASRDVGFGTVEAAGDVNGDGLMDLLAMTSGGAGPIYLVLGQRALPSGTIAIEDVGIPLHTGPGAVAASVGDLDGDGMDEIGVTAGVSDSTAYVLYGRHAWPDELDVADAADLRLPSLGEDGEGCIVLARGGDFDGDGNADLLCFDQSYHHGAIVVGLGTEVGLRDTVDLAAVGLTLLGRDASGFTQPATRWAPGSGPALAAGSDLDGDGLDDLAVGFPDTEPEADSSHGIVHVLFGRSTR